MVALPGFSANKLPLEPTVAISGLLLFHSNDCSESSPNSLSFSSNDNEIDFSNSISLTAPTIVISGFCATGGSSCGFAVTEIEILVLYCCPL